MPVDISIQLFTLREQLKADYEGTIRTLAEIGFRKVEPAGFPGTTPEAAARLFAELGIEAPSCHGGLPIGDDKQQVIETALTMGHKYLITGVPPGAKDNYQSADAVDAMAEVYAEAAANAAEHGLQVGYHNHDWDLVEIDGEPAHRRFLARTPESVLYEADLFWVAKAGLDPVAFVEELGDRGRCLHFKDGVLGEVDGAPFRPAGTGEVPLQAAFAAAKDHAEYLAVELDRYDGDLMQAVEQSFTFLTALVG